MPQMHMADQAEPFERRKVAVHDRHVASRHATVQPIRDLLGRQRFESA